MEALDVWQVLGKRQRAAVDGKALRGKVGREERSAGSQNSFFFFSQQSCIRAVDSIGTSEVAGNDSGKFIEEAWSFLEK